jgi:hypothetical protein
MTVNRNFYAALLFVARNEFDNLKFERLLGPIVFNRNVFFFIELIFSRVSTYGKRLSNKMDSRMEIRKNNQRKFQINYESILPFLYVVRIYSEKH